MGLVKLIWLYLGSAAVFLALDMLWLGLIARNLYRNSLKPLLAERFNRIAALSFYAIFIAGILIFATVPALDQENFARAAIYGALFGFFAYSTYDLTNLATLKNWQLRISLIDIAWGTALTSIVASFSYAIGGWINF